MSQLDIKLSCSSTISINILNLKCIVNHELKNTSVIKFLHNILKLNFLTYDWFVQMGHMTIVWSFGQSVSQSVRTSAAISEQHLSSTGQANPYSKHTQKPGKRG